MHLPDRRCLAGTVAAFGFASYVSIWRVLLWGGFTYAYSFFELFVHGLFGHEILLGLTFRNFSCGYAKIRLGCMRVASHWIEFQIYHDDTSCSRKRERR